MSINVVYTNKRIPNTIKNKYMFQKCPICNGTGEVPSNLLDTTCSVCKGEKIISTLTGLPPNRYIQQLPSTIDPSVIGPHTSTNNNSNWGLPDNTFAPVPTPHFSTPEERNEFYRQLDFAKANGFTNNTYKPIPTAYVRNPDDDKKLFPEQPKL